MTDALTEYGPREVAIVSTTLSAEALEEFIAALPSADVPAVLLAVEDAKSLMSVAQKGLEARLVLDGKTGSQFVIHGKQYGFFGAQARGWQDIPTLFANLRTLGVSAPDFADAISELKVTVLRAAASSIHNAEDRAAALELIESHRVDKGTRGTPHLVALDRLSK